MKPNRFRFRAWTGKRMTDEVIVLNGTAHDEEFCRRFDEWILMQSTGLADKNGKEIFEGDIVMVQPFDHGGKLQRTVVYARGGFHLDIDACWNGTLSNMDCFCEVIGNIHEGVKT